MKTTPPSPDVTVHALLRYLERVRGFNFDKERREIEDICRGVISGTVKKHGCRFEITNGKVITVVPTNPRPNRTTRLKHQRKDVT